MYILVFISAIVLRYKKPDVSRSYKIPLKNFGMWLVAGTGIVGSLSAIIVGFHSPSQLKTGSDLFYILFLALGVLIVIITPFIIYYYKSPNWKPKKIEAKK